MNDILMTNIFFLITAISSIITTILLIIALVYFIKFIKKLQRISTVVEDETLRIVNDVENVRSNVKQKLSVLKEVGSGTLLNGLIEKIFKKK